MTGTTGSQSGSPYGPTRWDRFLYWCHRFHEWDDFDENERNYKLIVAERLESAKQALFDGDPTWLDVLSHAVSAPPNNLSSWRATEPFLKWCRADPDHSGLAFRTLWNDALLVAQRMDGFGETLAPARQRLLIAETSFFHMAMDPYAYPMHRATPVERAMILTGYPDPKEAGIKSGELGRRYEHFLRFLDIMIKRAADRGLHLRDRLDAQSVAWSVTQWQPPAPWPEQEKRAFLAYQGEATLRKESWPK